MKFFHVLGFSRARMLGIRLLSVATMLMVALASFVAGFIPAAAQMEFDFNGDGSVTCADFQEEFPDTFTDEATEALRQYPDDLSDLNRDSEDDNVACEGQPASGQSEDEPPPAQAPEPEAETPAPVAEPEPEPEAAAPAPSPAAAELPADVMARVEGCAVVSVSPHSLVGAGCPGVGVVTYRVPDGAPLLEGQVIFNPGASQSAGANQVQDATASTGANGSRQNANSAERAQKAANADDGKDKDRASKQQSADDTKANKGKSKKQDRDSKTKNKNKKGGKGKKDNDNKGGKNKGKRGKK